ncbi:MAG: hypothetical protein AAFQ80_12605 [Cyanobacteria bacterium J06621_8]
MQINIVPFSFELDSVTLSSSFIWSLALYIGLDSSRTWISTQLERWFNFAEGWLYTSPKEFEETRPARESQNAFYASVFSIVPFLVAGAMINWLIDIGFGGISWSLSLGLMTCAFCSLAAFANQEYGDEERED